MAETSIEWTDRTWNPVVGCAKVSPGCARCYAETMGSKLAEMAKSDIGAGRIHLNDKKGGDPAEWPEDLRVREFPTPQRS